MDNGVCILESKVFHQKTNDISLHYCIFFLFSPLRTFFTALKGKNI